MATYNGTKSTLPTVKTTDSAFSYLVSGLSPYPTANLATAPQTHAMVVPFTNLAVTTPPTTAPPVLSQSWSS